MTMHYFGIVHHEPGTAYGVSFPDVPDCFAAADDEKDILKNAIDALEDYFADGHPLPQARGLEDLRAELSEDLAEGAFLIAVPYIPRPTKSVRMNISMDQGLVKAIDEAAKRLTLSRSAFLAQAAMKEIREEHGAP